MRLFLLYTEKKDYERGKEAALIAGEGRGWGSQIRRHRQVPLIPTRHRANQNRLHENPEVLLLGSFYVLRFSGPEAVSK